MHSSKQTRGLFRHWEYWFGMLLYTGCVSAGSYLGSVYFGHPLVLAIIGGTVGGCFLSVTLRHVEQCYELNKLPSYLRNG